MLKFFLNFRYFIIRKLAFGHFSTVWLAYNKDCHDYVAIKISRAEYVFTETAMEEIQVNNFKNFFKNYQFFF